MPGSGRLVLHALIRARLLGLRLLTIEARVLIEPDSDAARAHPVRIQARSSPGLGGTRPGEQLPPGTESAYNRAIQLLEQGEKALDRSQPPGFVADLAELGLGGLVDARGERYVTDELGK